MKIPIRDESSYDYESDPNYEFCFHCNKCVMTHDNQIYREGLFYCFSKRQWIAGDELIRKNCKGFELKTCANCRWQNTERCQSEFEEGMSCLYCNRWKPMYLPHPEIFLMGRVYRHKNESPYILYAESRFAEILDQRIDDIRNPKPPKPKQNRYQKFYRGDDIPLVAYMTSIDTGEEGYLELPSLEFAEVELGIRVSRIPRYIATEKEFSYLDEETGELWKGKLDLQDKENYNIVEYETPGRSHKGRIRYRIARTEETDGKKARTAEVQEY